MNLKNNKGVTLIALAITVMVMITLSTIIIYRTDIHVKMQKIDKLYSDITNLNGKIDEYYLEKGDIPTLGSSPYCTKNELISLLADNASLSNATPANSTDNSIITNPNDDDNYYVIDVEKLEGLTLNYGYSNDFKNAKSNPSRISSSTIKDVYIINKFTHQIYYPKGVASNGAMYYSYDLDTNAFAYEYAGETQDVKVTINGTEVTSENVAGYLGKRVTNYTGKETVSIDGKDYTVSPIYRLYYIDFDGKYGEKGTIYLKAECAGNNYSLPITETAQGKNSIPDTIKIKDLNPELYKDSNTGPTTSNNNMKAVTWLTNTEHWKDLADESHKDDINYIVGAPSVEMMMDSYNIHYNLTGDTPKTGTLDQTSKGERAKLFYQYNQGESGYKVGPADGSHWGIYSSYYSVKTDLKIDTMYYPGNGQYYWLASPSAYDSGHVIRVFYRNGGYVGLADYGSDNALCPLVSLKSSVQLKLPVEQKNEIAELKEEQQEKALTENKTLNDPDGDKVVIPANFHIEKDSPTEVEEGIVIEDSDDNQYVWIPVFEKSEIRDWGADYTAVKNETEGTEGYYKAIETALKKYTTTYKSNGSYSDEWYGDAANYGKYGYYDESDTNKENFIYYTDGNMTKEQYETLYHNMLKSVYKNGGFYIGRYGMGTAVVNSADEAQENTRIEMKEYTATGTYANNTAPSIDGMPTPVSKANAVPYTYITQLQAEMLAEKLGEGDEYKNSVYTSIMFGVQWDAVCVFIENYDTNNNQSPRSDWLKTRNYGKYWGNYAESSYTMNRGFYTSNQSSSYGRWYPQAAKSSQLWICTTGAVDKYSSLNIYDFGGNVSEWTLERNKSDIYPCVSRSGSCGSFSYASERGISGTCSVANTISSRLTLYIK